MKKPREFHDNESENISYPVNLSVESELLCRSVSFKIVL